MGVLEDVNGDVREALRLNIVALVGRERHRSEFARKVGTTPQNVSHWCAGDTVPSLEKMGEIAAAYGLPIGALFDGADYEKVGLTADEDELLETFRSMDMVGRRMLLATARAYRESGEFDA